MSSNIPCVSFNAMCIGSTVRIYFHTHYRSGHKKFILCSPDFKYPSPELSEFIAHMTGRECDKIHTKISTLGFEKIQQGILLVQCICDYDGEKKPVRIIRIEPNQYPDKQIKHPDLKIQIPTFMLLRTTDAPKPNLTVWE